MEFLKPRNSEVHHDIAQEINHAKKSALSEGELESIKDEQDFVTAEFLQGRLTGKEYGQKMKILDRQEGVIKRSTITEYTSLLRSVGLSEEGIRETISHENEHMVEGIQAGVEPIYQVQFLREVGGTTGMYPSINFEFPESMSDEQQRKILREILEAPEELSERDQSQLR